MVDEEEGDRGLVEEKEEEEEDKKQAILKKLASIPIKKRPTSIPIPVPTPDEVPVPTSPLSKNREEIASTKRKDFRSSLPRLPEKPASISTAVKAASPPPPPPSPTPALPVPSPLPHFILQFQHTDWFQVLFPVVGPLAFPESITASKFVSQLLEGFKLVNLQMKVGVINAILLLYEQEGFDNVKEVHDALISGLNPKEPLNLQVPDQREFILASLKALKILSCGSKELTLELMTYFQQATLSLRKPLMALFGDLGLQDPHGYFYKEMDSWETWKETDGSKASLKGTCCRWLDEWIANLQDHVTRVLQALPQAALLTRASSRSLQSKKGHVSKALQGASTAQTSSHSLQSKKGRVTGMLQAVPQGASLTGTSSRSLSSKKDHESRLEQGVPQGDSPRGISSHSLQNKTDHETRLEQGVPQGDSPRGVSSHSLQSKKEHETRLELGIPPAASAPGISSAEIKKDHESRLEQGVPQGASAVGISSSSLQSKKAHETRPEWSLPQGASATGLSSHSQQSKTGKKSKVRIAGQADVCLDLSSIEAINYFCEVQHEKELEALKQQQVPKNADEKNTVVTLPAIDRCDAIMRLGETHSMTRTRQMENFYLPPISQHNFLSGFGPFINFPLKKINLNPFPSVLDLDITPSLIASLNQMAHRYFILDHSFPESYIRNSTAGLAAAKLPERYRGLHARPIPPPS